MAISPTIDGNEAALMKGSVNRAIVSRQADDKNHCLYQKEK